MSEFIYPQLQGLKAAYDRDGYVIIRRVLDRDLVGEANQHIDWLIKKHPDLRPELLGYSLVPDDPFWIRLVSDKRLLDVAEQVVGPNIALFAADYIAKPPREGRKIAWHQDGNYWPLEPMTVVTMWVAYTASTPENGCVRIIPGTQHMTLQERRSGPNDPPDVLLTGMDQSLASESEAVDIVLEPGDVSIHHPHIIHGSNANTSENWRRGGTYQYIPTTTRILDEQWPTFLFRGQAEKGINSYRAFPKYKLEEHFPFRGCEDWQ
ncbi:phytanoyl-CoA dioxygenase family protein [Chloroflexi bacterium TSY]|nr:phytanoyl-CoA dioxygenase family protein [Chloroflexi bacterium TSY]